MKKLILLTLVLAILLSGCGKEKMDVDRLGWTIVKSPITGRYYEIAAGYSGNAGFMAMSEVTQDKYEDYILEGGK